MSARIDAARLQELRDQYGRRECLSPKGEPHIELDDIANALDELIERRAATGAEAAAPAVHSELLRVLWEEIGAYSVQCAATGELAPSSSLVTAIDAVSESCRTPAEAVRLTTERRLQDETVSILRAALAEARAERDASVKAGEQLRAALQGLADRCDLGIAGMPGSPLEIARAALAATRSQP